ncbi:hypothetical protein B0H17DRAFT_352589 [Mycena rosella]|uniref:Uncharacterized protein n=1 Tax=Mycena rosella TaxID=1033263 RepID=A0AAD7CQ54_MYCRO|nr:hypothetical protein B0H17DRAFT_352589 [Mycena rosella]
MAAGGAVGGVIILIAGILLCLFLRKRRRSQALYLSSRPDSPFRDAERSMPTNSSAPVFSMVTPHTSAAPSVPSIVVDSPEMAQVSPSPSNFNVHKKPVPSIAPQDFAAVAAPAASTKPVSYTLEVDPPSSSMSFDHSTFAQSLGQNPAWASVLKAPATASANPFADPENPFADPQPKTRLSEMPEIPNHLRMSTTSSSLDDEPHSPTGSISTVYHDAFAI